MLRPWLIRDMTENKVSPPARTSVRPPAQGGLAVRVKRGGGMTIEGACPKTQKDFLLQELCPIKPRLILEGLEAHVRIMEHPGRKGLG